MALDEVAEQFRSALGACKGGARKHPLKLLLERLRVLPLIWHCI
jgi:hypothetical protein